MKPHELEKFLDSLGICTNINQSNAIIDWHERRVAAAVTERTRASVIAACNAQAAHSGSHIEIARALNALDSPPAPPSPFGCACWSKQVTGDVWWREAGHINVPLSADASFCEVCGAPRRKETTP